MNPIMMMMQMLMSGGNPTKIINQVVGQNPQLAPAAKLIQGKSPEELEKVFYNLCQSKGIDPAQVAGQYGISLPPR